MQFSILGLGTAVPSHTVGHDEALELASAVCCQSVKHERLAKVLYRMCGVAKRHTCVPTDLALDWIANSGLAETNGQAEANGEAEAGGVATVAAPVVTDGPTTDERMELYREHAFPLAQSAVQNALHAADVAPSEITHLVTVSCTGFYAPGVDVQLIESFGMPRTTQRTHVGFMGCHGAINGVRTAAAYGTSDPQAVVLLCAVELCSLHYAFRWDPNRIVGNALFADGAAALVGRGGGGPLNGQPRHADRRFDNWGVVAAGSCLIPDSTDDMSWRIGDHGFEMVLSPQVPDAITAHLRPWLCEWLQQHGYALDQIQSWVIHPGGPRIVEAVAETLNLPPQATEISRQVLSEHGNMSSPTVLFILDRLIRQQAQPPCVMMAFGPGLMAEAVLLDRVEGA